MIPKPPPRKKPEGRPLSDAVTEAAKWVMEGGWTLKAAAEANGVSIGGVWRRTKAIRSGKMEAPWLDATQVADHDPTAKKLG